MQIGKARRNLFGGGNHRSQLWSKRGQSFTVSEEGEEGGIKEGREEEGGVGKEKRGSKWLMKEFLQLNWGF